jgi:hypothetical protein
VAEPVQKLGLTIRIRCGAERCGRDQDDRAAG